MYQKSIKRHKASSGTLQTRQGITEKNSCKGFLWAHLHHTTSNRYGRKYWISLLWNRKFIEHLMNNTRETEARYCCTKLNSKETEAKSRYFTWKGIAKQEFITLYLYAEITEQANGCIEKKLTEARSNGTYCLQSCFVNITVDRPCRFSFMKNDFLDSIHSQGW